MKKNKVKTFKILLISLFNLFIIFNITLFLTTNAMSKIGSRGEEVKKIQQKLTELGIFNDKIDGIYGIKTSNAVKIFQKNNGLQEDGIAGPQTLKKLGISSSIESSKNNVSNSNEQLLARIISAEARGEPYLGQIAVGQTLKKLGISSSIESSKNNVSNSNEQLLARIISAEARGEPYLGQIAVGAVIMNRIQSPSFPDTLAGVIYENGAFTAIIDGQFNEPIAESAIRAAKDALNGHDPTGGAIYYFNPNKTTNPWMHSRPVLKQIGDHLFCS